MFSVAEKQYAIEINHLKEISAAAVATRVPGMSNFVQNMVPFRGKPIPVLDLRRIQGGDALKHESPQQIVAQFDNTTCALWVSKVYQVKRLESMNKSVGINKKQFGTMSSLVKDVLWDQGKNSIGLLDSKKLNKFLEITKERTSRIGFEFKNQPFKNDKEAA